MKTRVSPTKMVLAYMRKRGVACEIVEKWVKIGSGGFRRDCFGGDALCITPNDTILVQAGIGAHHSAKIRKAIEDPKVAIWIAAPCRIFQVWTFSRRVAFNKSGSRAKNLKWTPRVSQIVSVGGKLSAVPFVLRD